MAELAWYWWAAIVAGLAGLYYWFYVR